MIENDNRIAVEDLLRNYVYFDDANDFDSIASIFTTDALFQTGRHTQLEGRDTIRAFAAELSTHANHGDRQRYFQPVRFVPTSRRYAALVLDRFTRDRINEDDTHAPDRVLR